MAFTLPSLPYDYGALEPYIDALTMEIHHNRHHQAYVDNLNKALQDYPVLLDKPVDELVRDIDSLPENVRTAVRNNGGGHYNHSLFWKLMKADGGGLPKGILAEAIKKRFNSFDLFQEQFNTAAKTRFGSGWAWLCVDKEGNLVINSSADQNSPLTDGMQVVMGLDVWEHAYYLKYQWRRPDYIKAWWHVLDWDFIEENYRSILGK